MPSWFRAALACLGVLIAASAAGAQTAIADLRAAPERWLNREVTVVGRVTAAAPNPAGTTRGFYTLLDDTDPAGVLVRSRDLPAIGREYAVTGTWILDPGTGAAMIDERDRRDAGGARAPVAAGGGGESASRTGPGIGLVLVLAAVVGALAVAGALLLRSRSAAPPPQGRTTAPPEREPAPAPIAPAGPRIDVTIEVASSEGAPRHRFRSAPIVIGRASGADLSIEDPEVSRRHAEIRVEDGRLVVVDLGSTHGTVVDGRRVERAEIRSGTEIQLGGTRLKVM